MCVCSMLYFCNATYAIYSYLNKREKGVVKFTTELATMPRQRIRITRVAAQVGGCATRGRDLTLLGKAW